MIRRLADRIYALSVVINRATALADAREDNVALARRVGHLERVVQAQADGERNSRVAAWRYWAKATEHHDSAVRWRQRARTAERALAELEPVVTGDQS